MKPSKVTLRQKSISKGRLSLYLDYYPPVRNKEGKKTRREFLGMYIAENPRTALEKNNNTQTLRIAEQIRFKRENELQKPEVYNQHESAQLKKFEKYDSDFIHLYEQLADKRQKGLYGAWTSSLHYFREFAGDSISCRNITASFANEYRDYLLDPMNARKAGRSLSINSALSYFNKFRAVLRYAYTNEYLEKDVRSQVDPIREERTLREFLTLEEYHALEATPFKNDLLRRASLFSIHTGLRFSDIKGLKWKNIIDTGNEVSKIRFKHKKTNSFDFHPISRDAREILGQRGEPDNKVFPKLTYSAHNNKLIQDWVHRAGINKKITFHCFRHTYATLLLSVGKVDIYTVSKMLGHKNVKTTQIYTNVMDEVREKAATAINFKK